MASDDPKPAPDDPKLASKDPKPAASWQQVVAAVASAAGGAAWVSTVGSAIVGLRLESVDLPVEATVALMSAEHRFVIGVGFLAAPVFVGLVGMIGDQVIAWARPGLSELARLWTAALATALGVGLGLLLLQPPDLWLYLTQGAVVLIAVPVVFIVMGRMHAQRHGRETDEPVLGRPAELRQALDERVVLFLTVLISAGVIALVFEARREATFDTVRVALTDGGTPLTGAYVTTGADAAILITRAGRCPKITAVPRSEIERIWIGPGAYMLDMPTGCEHPHKL